MNTRQDALASIVALAHEHQLSSGEIATALKASRDDRNSSTTLTKVLAYLGGIFILAGICTYTGMFWGSMGSFARVLITLGSGVVCLLMGLSFYREQSYKRAIPVMFVLAGLLQPGGMFVLIYEYFRTGNDWHAAPTLVFSLLFLQQFALFTKYRSAVLLFFSLTYAFSLYFTLTDWMGISYKLSGLVAGVSLLSLSHALSRYYREQEYNAVIGLGYAIGAIFLFCSAFSMFQGTAFEVVYLGLCVLMIYLSTEVRSTLLLAISVLSLLSYIGYFTARHFVNSIGWPVSLIVFGVLMILISAGAIKIKRKYIPS
ncbi:MAG: DUF2157 domain-containing protein [Rickettsiales bacterium]|nr:DUF2157 domain-containing protein [Rickettsiales bacterium]